RRLAADLAAHGAPLALARRAAAAARDEVRHAARCLALVEGYGGCRWTFAIAPAAGAATATPVAGADDIDALVSDSWLDGCLGEGLAARAADEARSGCRERLVRAVLDEIARDEAEHAELAWAILAHFTGRPGSEGERARVALRRAIDDVGAAHVAESVAPPACGDDAIATRNGRVVDARRVGVLRAEVFDAARRRALALVHRSSIGSGPPRRG